MNLENPTIPMDACAIREILPHRYPFLLIDRVIEMTPGEMITAIKCVSQNEPYLRGHFPDYPVMPGVLLIEAMAQTGAILLQCSAGGDTNRTGMLTTVDACKIRRPVLPGDVMTIQVFDFRVRRGFGKARGHVTVDGEVCSEATVGFALIEL